MSTLVKRASPQQARILRIVYGSIKQTCDAHPAKYIFDMRFARSVSKRATGTLTAQWPDVLAAKEMPLGWGEFNAEIPPQQRVSVHGKRAKRGANGTGIRSPYYPAWRLIASQMWKVSENNEKREAYIEILRLLQVKINGK